MKIIQKGITVSEDLIYYTKHLEIINAFIPSKLTEKEREVLAMFMSFKGDLANKDRFGTSFRKEVMKRLGLTPGGLGNYIRIFKDKDIITDNLDGTFMIKSYLFPEEKEQFYQFKLIKKEED